MARFRLRLGRIFVLVCTCVLVPAFATAAEPWLAVDFDGDGRRDQVTLDRREPTALHVWLSATDSTQIIRTRLPLTQVRAKDLDGDGRPELIASDGSLQIHVWSRTRQGFHSYRERDRTGSDSKRPSRRSVDDNDTEPVGVLTSSGFSAAAGTFCASLHAPRGEVASARLPQSDRLSRLLAAIDPFAPRPPPARFLV